MRTTYHCNRTVKEHCLWVSLASGYGLICGREDEAVATDSLSAYNLVYGKGDHSLAAPFKERCIITCSFVPAGAGVPVFPEGTILR